jgi:hypothetical protein
VLQKTAQIQVDDGFEGCQGNNTIASAFNLNIAGNNNYDSGSLTTLPYTTHGTPIAKDADVYRFDIPGSRYVNITAFRLSGTDSVTVQILNSSGTVLQSAIAGTGNAELGYNNCDDGNRTFYIRVTPAGSGSTATYNIQWEDQNDGCL